MLARLDRRRLLDKHRGSAALRARATEAVEASELERALETGNGGVARRVALAGEQQVLIEANRLEPPKLAQHVDVRMMTVELPIAAVPVHCGVRLHCDSEHARAAEELDHVHTAAASCVVVIVTLTLEVKRARLHSKPPEFLGRKPVDDATKSCHGRWQSTAGITAIDDEQLALPAQAPEETERRRECGLRLASAAASGPGGFVAQPRVWIDQLFLACVGVHGIAADEAHSIEQTALAALHVRLDRRAAVRLL